jgi:hypothetical protein
MNIYQLLYLITLARDAIFFAKERVPKRNLFVPGDGDFLNWIGQESSRCQNFVGSKENLVVKRWFSAAFHFH